MGKLEWHTFPDVPGDDCHRWAMFLVHEEMETHDSRVNGGKWQKDSYSNICAWDAEAQAFIGDQEVDGIPAKPCESGTWFRNNKVWWAEISTPAGSFVEEEAFSRIDAREADREQAREESRRFRDEDYYCARDWEERWE